jgi:hypothetical protein
MWPMAGSAAVEVNREPGGVRVYSSNTCEHPTQSEPSCKVGCFVAQQLWRAHHQRPHLNIPRRSLTHNLLNNKHANNKKKMGCCMSHPEDPPLPPQPLPEQRPTQPLRPRAPWTSKHPVTRRQLERRREEFWDTRVTGRREVWMALKAAVECMQGEGGVELARGIVEAAGVTVPSGELTPFISGREWLILCRRSCKRCV